MSERFVMILEKAGEVEDEDGVLTPKGMEVAHLYAKKWQNQKLRDSALEATYPELIGLFYDIRNDEELAAEHALPLGKSESVYVLPFDKAKLSKAVGGPFYGPKGGKWADPQHKIPWKEGKPGAKQRKPVEKKAVAREWVEYRYGHSFQTIEAFRIQEGDDATGKSAIYRPERKKLHDTIIKKFFETDSGKPIPKPQAGVKKVAIVMMGGPASGKTSTVKHLLGVEDFGEQGFVNVNPDDVKVEIPEYKNALEYKVGDKTVSARDAAWLVHEESSDIAGEIYNLAVEKGMNIVFDGTGKDADKHGKRIRALRDAGYHVQLVMPDVDIDDAVKRSLERAENTGRHVPIDKVLRPAHLAIPGNFERLAREADEFYLFDTRSKSGKKEPPKLKWSGSQGKADILHDEQWVNDFKERGRAFHRQLEASKARAPISKSMVMRKSMNERPALTYGDIIQNLEKTKDKVWKHEKGERKFPGAGKEGKGVIWPVEDFDPKRTRIKYQ